MSQKHGPYDQPHSLLEATVKLANEFDGTLPELYKATNISFYWLRKFKAGEFKNPSVNRVQWLYEFLSGKKLDF